MKLKAHVFSLEVFATFLPVTVSGMLVYGIVSTFGVTLELALKYGIVTMLIVGLFLTIRKYSKHPLFERKTAKERDIRSLLEQQYVYPSDEKTETLLEMPFSQMDLVAFHDAQTVRIPKSVTFFKMLITAALWGDTRLSNHAEVLLQDFRDGQSVSRLFDMLFETEIRDAVREKCFELLVARLGTEAFLVRIHREIQQRTLPPDIIESIQVVLSSQKDVVSVFKKEAGC